MCVAIPAQVTSIEPDGRRATALVAGEVRGVDLAMTPTAGVGDWIIMHSGFAVRQITAEEAAHIHELLTSLDS